MEDDYRHRDYFEGIEPEASKKEEDRYYPTKIDDIRVGYEMYCPIGVENDMAKVICTNIYDLHAISNRVGDNYTFPHLYQTRYLNKKDIESLGWKHRAKFTLLASQDNYKEEISHLFELENYILIFDKNTYKVIITLGLPENILFKGICPSINELRYVLNLLNIKINLVSLKQ